MKIIKQMIFKKGLRSITVFTLGFSSFVASADDGIANNVTSSSETNASAGQLAVFTAMTGEGNQVGLCESFGEFGGSTLACQLISSNQSNSNGTSLQQLSPQAAMQAETISITSPKKFIRSINNKAQKLIECDNHQAQEDKTECINGGGASADTYSFIGPFGVSLSGGGGIGDRETVNGQTGFQLDTRQANLMLDYSFSQQLVGGFSFGYLGTERDLGLNSGSLDSDSFRFAPFLLFRPTTNSYLSLTGGYALINYDSIRTVSEFNSISVTDATADYDADQYFASLSMGYNFTFMNGWSLRGYGGGDYIHTDIDGFQEIGGKGSDNKFYSLKVKGQSIDSVTSTVGAELSYAINTSVLYPAVIIPKLRAEWVHEFKNSGETIQATYNGNSTSVPLGTIAINGSERNWANLGFGLQMLFPHAIVGFVNYDALIISNASNHTITGGIRINF